MAVPEMDDKKSLRLRFRFRAFSLRREENVTQLKAFTHAPLLSFLFV